MNNLYNFGQFALDPRRRTLSHADSPVFLTPKAFDVLTFLVQNPNRLVTKDELLQAVWGDTFVEEGNLKQYISHLRKALGDDSGDPRLIVPLLERAISSSRMSVLPKRLTSEGKSRVKSRPRKA
jgi:DNA-binding winged helix-turn-helix (wHTH) protein